MQGIVLCAMASKLEHNGYRYILVPDLELQTYQNSINYERSRKVK